MRSWVSIVLVALAGLVILACGGDTSDGPPFGSGGTGGTGGVTLNCETLENPPPDCNKPCTSDTQCEASFCNSGVCVANCASDEDCDENSTCNVSGRCILNMGTGGTGGTGNIGGGCQSVTITPTRSIPNVMFLVDQSGSMDAGFGGGENRWEAANTVINGIVSSTDSIVRYGLTTYTSRQRRTTTRRCPRLPTEIDFALGNSSNIGDDTLSIPTRYPERLRAHDTPDRRQHRRVGWQHSSSPPPEEGPTIIVLATDGAPDSCEYPNPSNGTQRAQAEGEAVTAAGGLARRGHRLVRALGRHPQRRQRIRDHLQEVANEGVGLAADGSGGDAPFWVGTDPQSLEDEFREIISASISCDIQMDKRFDDKEQACNDPESDVQLNGTPLSCPSDWIVKPGVDDVIELVGSACDTFKSGDATFSATFPCGAIVVE